MTIAKKIILMGAGPLGLNVAHILKKHGKYELAGFIDSKQAQVGGIEVLGNDDIIDSLIDRGIRYALVCIGNSKKRSELSTMIKQKGFIIPTLIHPSADIGIGVRMGEGTVVFHDVFIGPDSEIGNSCIVEAGAFVGHNVKIGEGVLLSARAIVGNSACIQDFSSLKLGAKCAGSINVGAHCTIKEFKTLDTDLAAYSEF